MLLMTMYCLWSPTDHPKEKICRYSCISDAEIFSMLWNHGHEFFCSQKKSLNVRLVFTPQSWRGASVVLGGEQIFHRSPLISLWASFILFFFLFYLALIWALNHFISKPLICFFLMRQTDLISTNRKNRLYFSKTYASLCYMSLKKLLRKKKNNVSLPLLG